MARLRLSENKREKEYEEQLKIIREAPGQTNAACCAAKHAVRLHDILLLYDQCQRMRSSESSAWKDL